MDQPSICHNNNNNNNNTKTCRLSLDSAPSAAVKKGRKAVSNRKRPPFLVASVSDIYMSREEKMTLTDNFLPV